MYEDNKLLINLFMSHKIAIVDPETGKVEDILDF